MDARRLKYLKAMDVDVWQRRDASPALTAVAPEAPRIAVLEPPQAFTLEPSKPAPTSVKPATPPIAAAPLTATALPSANAEQMANADWETLERTVKDCRLCALRAGCTQTVFGIGNRQAEWLIVGEAPGAEEDKQGEPFVGRAGQLLNSMLRAMGFPRPQVFIANILKCRPPGNRDPKPEEADCCAPYLARQIELVNPRIILCVGRIAAQNLLSTDTPIGKLRGKVHRLGARQRPVVVTYHPAYLLRSPGEKRKAWEDLQLALRTYDSAPARLQ